MRDRLSTVVFCGAMFAAGLIVTGIGLAMFHGGYGAEAVVFVLGSGAVLGFIIGAREAGERYAEENPHDTCCAEEGAWRF